MIGQPVEEGVGREVDLALLADRADPADRPRRHDCLERIVGQAVVVLGGLVEHGANLTRAFSGEVDTGSP
jgi:hypothetical protein